MTCQVLLRKQLMQVLTRTPKPLSVFLSSPPLIYAPWAINNNTRHCRGLGGKEDEGLCSKDEQCCDGEFLPYHNPGRLNTLEACVRL